MARGEVEMAALGASQHGVLRLHQLLELGMSEATVRRRRRAGELVDVQPGVVRHRAHPDTWRSRLLAACLSTGGIASHRSAAIVWQLDSISGGIVDVTVGGPSASRRRGVVVHHSTQMDRADVIKVDGIPTTGAARTLLDLAAVVPPRLLESAVDDALRLRRTSWPELFAAVLSHSARGRNGCWHLNARSFEADPMRWNRLTTVGCQVYPFTWAFFVDEPDELCRIIGTALRRPSARAPDRGVRGCRGCGRRRACRRRGRQREPPPGEPRPPRRRRRQVAGSRPARRPPRPGSP